MRRIDTIATVLLVIACAALAGCSKEEDEGKQRVGGKMNVTKSVTVEAIQPHRGEFVVRREYPGEFVSDAMAELSSEVGGRVRDITVRLGDVVEKGDVLASVDPVTYQQRVRELQASVALSKAGIEEAKVQKKNLQSELARKKPLLDRKLVTEREIEDLESRVQGAQQRLEVARATVQQNEARLAAARDSLSDTRIRAPFDGVVAERYVDIGSHVSPGQAILRVVDKDQIWLRARVPEQDSGLVRAGMPVSLRVDALGGKELAGEIGRVAPAVDPGTRTLRVDVGPADDADWSQVKPGMYARAQLVLGERDDAVTLTNQALQKGRDGARYVWIVDDGKARKQTITPGMRGRERTEIVEGLSVDDLVVLRGIEKLRPGAEVTVINKDEVAVDEATDEEDSQ